jgi:hypothetical protein
MVYVTYEKDGRVEDIAKFPNIKAAEDFIADQELADPEGVASGCYGVDADQG